MRTDCKQICRYDKIHMLASFYKLIFYYVSTRNSQERKKETKEGEKIEKIKIPATCRYFNLYATVRNLPRNFVAVAPKFLGTSLPTGFAKPVNRQTVRFLSQNFVLLREHKIASQFMCPREESKLTVSVPQLDIFVRFAPKISQSGFDSLDLNENYRQVAGIFIYVPP